MPRFTTASATRSSRIRSSVVNNSGPDLVEKAWESSVQILSHFPGRDVLVKEAISVWKGSRNQLSSGIIWRGLGRVNEAPRSKLRGILRNSPKPLPSFAKATEGSPRLHPRSELRGIRRRRIRRNTSAMTLWIIESLLFAGMVSLIWAILDILGGDPHVENER